jgi:hypothetical protein
MQKIKKKIDLRVESIISQKLNFAIFLIFLRSDSIYSKVAFRKAKKIQSLMHI